MGALTWGVLVVVVELVAEVSDAGTVELDVRVGTVVGTMVGTVVES